MTHNSEKWKQIESSPYFISSLGRIRKKQKNKPDFKYLSGSKSTNGYICIGGSKNRLLKRKVYIHKFVAENFIGEIPKGYVVHHVDEDKQNNCVDNLRIITHKEHNDIHRSSNKPKLSSEQVRTIRKQYYLANLSRAEIYRLYPFSSSSAINRVINCIDGYYEDFDDPIFDAVYYADKPHIVNTYDGGRIQKWRHPNK